MTSRDSLSNQRSSAWNCSITRLTIHTALWKRCPTSSRIDFNVASSRDSFLGTLAGGVFAARRHPAEPATTTRSRSGTVGARDDWCSRHAQGHQPLRSFRRAQPSMEPGKSASESRRTLRDVEEFVAPQPQPSLSVWGFRHHRKRRCAKGATLELLRRVSCEADTKR